MEASFAVSALTPADVVVLHASNFVEAKRPLDIARSAVQAMSVAPELVYLIVGDGCGRPAVQTFCQTAHLSHRFRFTGWVEHAQMAEYLNLADIVVMTSESEALPLIYLEAQACGRVLIASDIPASREVIVEGQTGLLFSTGDVPQLARKILAVVRDGDRRRAIGDKARQAASAHDLNRTVAEHLELLAEVAADRGRAPYAAGRSGPGRSAT
jgi:glycosyltransferase involved in cell wall biosynthesis